MYCAQVEETPIYGQSITGTCLGGKFVSNGRASEPVGDKFFLFSITSCPGIS